jgi:superoxide reductase
MLKFEGLFQSADWKTEKHVPVIDTPDRVKKGEFFKVGVEIGKAVAHPNTTEHHIKWISLFYLPKDEKFPYQIARIDFSTHGESVAGINASTIYTNHEAIVSFKTDKPGTIIAVSQCNIHGLWQNSKELNME